MFDAPHQPHDRTGLLAGPGLALSSLAQSQSLAELPRGVDATVVGVLAPTLEEDRELVLRLIEIGFVPGEPVRVVAFGLPGREPIAVRLGATTFALRRFEADYVRVLVNRSDPAL